MNYGCLCVCRLESEWWMMWFNLFCMVGTYTQGIQHKYIYMCECVYNCTHILTYIHTHTKYVLVCICGGNSNTKDISLFVYKFAFVYLYLIAKSIRRAEKYMCSTLATIQCHHQHQHQQQCQSAMSKVDDVDVQTKGKRKGERERERERQQKKARNPATITSMTEKMCIDLLFRLLLPSLFLMSL